MQRKFLEVCAGSLLGAVLLIPSAAHALRPPQLPPVGGGGGAAPCPGILMAGDTMEESGYACIDYGGNSGVQTKTCGVGSVSAYVCQCKPTTCFSDVNYIYTDPVYYYYSDDGGDGD
jgi:hypothetical protein